MGIQGLRVQSCCFFNLAVKLVFYRVQVQGFGAYIGTGWVFLEAFGGLTSGSKEKHCLNGGAPFLGLIIDMEHDQKPYHHRNLHRKPIQHPPSDWENLMCTLKRKN